MINMQKSIGVVVPDLCINESDEFVEYLEHADFISKVMVYGTDVVPLGMKFSLVNLHGLNSAGELKNLGDIGDFDYLFILKDKTWFNPGQFAFERMLSVAEDTGTGIVYSDYIEIKEGIQKYHPVIDYQEGSLRDDFDFGPLWLVRGKALKEAVSELDMPLEKAGLYYLRLKISSKYNICRIPEYLYTVRELDSRKSGQVIFDYVDPKNRQVQIEMENVATAHLKNTGAYLEPNFKPISFDEKPFKYKASVIIPVKNRIKTIEDAVQSVLKQKTNFAYNLIVVDNHSNDGTSGILEFIAGTDNRLIHHTPERTDLGIGGCWNEGVHHPDCGMFAVQLDSDDLYKDENTLQKIVDAFYTQNCAMVVGTYQLVNFKLEEIPPGIIDHKEWTPENGRNNALRINGLGAPRAFYTPLLREINIPNVSYGEDYAVGLAISRHYQIGRIYENIYLCRRWDDNSDAALDIEKMNRHNVYKDRIRTIELKARQKLNQEKK
jgi:hypothetical protein